MNTQKLFTTAKIAIVGLLVLTSAPLIAYADNPTPTVSNISPTSQVSGSAAFTITVNGTNFVPGSVVYFNNSARSTSYISPTQLTASINASDLSTVGNYTVGVLSPTPGGGSSNNVTFTVSAAGNNPVPSVSSISPSTRAVSSGAFTLTVNGTNFVPNSQVSFNGISRPTTYVSPSQVTAAIPAFDMNTAGIFLVAVSNPTPAGGLSNYVPFNVSGSTTTPELPNTGFGPAPQPEAQSNGMVAASIATLLAMSLAAAFSTKRLLATK